MPTPKISHIIEWNLERGFGFLAGDGDEGRVFLHVKELIGGARQPQVGDRIEYTLGSDMRGRPQAVGATNLRPCYHLSAVNWITFLLVLILPVAALLKLLYLGWGAWIAIFGGIASLTAYSFYLQDKKLAEKGRWRISETRLHVLEVIGGWPGAFMAQRRLRHKSSKRSYQFFFWIIVVGYQIVSIDVLRHGEVSYMAWSLLRALVAVSLPGHDPALLG